MAITVDPRLSEPHLFEPSIIRTTKLMIFIAFVVCIELTSPPIENILLHLSVIRMAW